MAKFEESDEEKAEEYVLYIPDTVGAKHSVYSEEKLKQAFKDGLAEGRKETTEKFSVVEKKNAELVDFSDKLEKQIEKMKCCGNCIHQYEGKTEDGVRCKDHYPDSVCKHWEYDDYTVQNRLDNEWS